MRYILLAFFLAVVVALPAQQSRSGTPIYRVGVDAIKPPQAISTPAPEMPQDGRKVKSAKMAILSAYVGTDGNLHGLKLVRSTGDSGLDAKALEKLATWKFHPCTKDGTPVNCMLNLEVEFHLYRETK